MKSLSITAFTGLTLMTFSLIAGECASQGNATVTHATNKPAVSQPKDIVDTAVGAGSFKTLAAALQAGDLVGALKGKGPFTVFAPTDDAFAQLPEGTLQELLKPENKAKLQSILTYHVVPGAVDASQVVKLSEATSLNGKPITITVKDGKVMVNNAMVTATDIRCSNGIIHVIDQVILPPAEAEAETAAK